MFRRISIAELTEAGVAIRYDETIAIAQQLIDACRELAPAGDDLRPPYGPPSPSNVLLGEDGSVACAGYDATLAVSEVGMFLQALLGYDSGRVPGAVRYTVARALLEVDAPPFDSLEDFSEALGRYERNDRAAAIRGLLERAASVDGALRLRSEEKIVERRRLSPEVAELRRQLRESDARVYDQQRALDALGGLHAADATTTRKRSRRVAIAAGLAAGLTLIGAGETMRLRDTAADGPPIAPRAIRQTAPEATVSAAPADARETIGPFPFEDSKLSSPEPNRKATPPAPSTKTTRPPRQPDRLRRLHLGWLRTRIAIRHDSL